MRFLKSSHIAAPASRVFAFHEAPYALQRLTPPCQRTTIVQPPRSLEKGTRVIIKTWLGPIPQTIVAEHVEYEAGRMFADRMIRGPFKHWLHRHIVTPEGDGSVLTDDVEYELPFGPLGKLGARFARRELERLFAYRHDVTR